MSITAASPTRRTADAAGHRCPGAQALGAHPVRHSSRSRTGAARACTDVRPRLAVGASSGWLALKRLAIGALAVVGGVVGLVGYVQAVVADEPAQPALSAAAEADPGL